MKRKAEYVRPFTMLSIDWDYFLPRETDTLDWGHAEGSPFFYELAWITRACTKFWTKDDPDKGKTAREVIQIPEQRITDFVERVLDIDREPISVCIVDSHKDIVAYLDSVSFKGIPHRIINFDAHHDCGYGQTKVLDCGNWVPWLKKTRKVDYTLVYPAWRKQHGELSKEDTRKKADRIIYGDWTDAPIQADAVFICRSSCWMPSWCDDSWLKLRAAIMQRGVIPIECDYIKTARHFTAIDWDTPMQAMMKEEAVA